MSAETFLYICAGFALLAISGVLTWIVLGIGMFFVLIGAAIADILDWIFDSRIWQTVTFKQWRKERKRRKNRERIEKRREEMRARRR